MERRMCLWSWQMVHGKVGMSLWAPNLQTIPHISPFLLTRVRDLRLSRRSHHASSVGTDGRGTKGQERGHRSRSCWPWTPSGLQTAEVRLPQDSVDVVIRAIAAVTMETMLQGAGRVFRLWAEGVLGDAVVLAVYARPGADHYWSLWTTDPIAAVTAGRLQTRNRDGLLIAASWMDAEAVNKIFQGFPDRGALHEQTKSHELRYMIPVFLLYSKMSTSFTL